MGSTNDIIGVYSVKNEVIERLLKEGFPSMSYRFRMVYERIISCFKQKSYF